MADSLTFRAYHSNGWNHEAHSNLGDPQPTAQMGILTAGREVLSPQLTALCRRRPPDSLSWESELAWPRPTVADSATQSDLAASHSQHHVHQNQCSEEQTLGESRRRAERKVVTLISPDQTDEIITVLCDAFREYPVMRHVIGPAGDEYDSRLTTLVGFFVAARVLRREPILVVDDGYQVAAVALLTSPGAQEAPAELSVLRENVWQELGPAARARYEELGRIWQQFTYPEPHYHLNMIGVLRSHSGLGVGRQLLDAVHVLSYSEPRSSGVSLTTEDPDNVELYEHFGYEILGHTNVSDAFETWGFFRRDRDENCE